MQLVEIELKFPVSSIASLEDSLRGLGFRQDTPRTFESNTLYDTPERTLRTQGQLLRLRQYGSTWTLTHKRQPSAPSLDPSRYKQRIETETMVTDGPALAAILTDLGYTPVFRYEKWRAEWSDPAVESGAHLVIDETPIGTYAELEGPPEWIDGTLSNLGVDESVCLTDSYGRLFLAWKQRTASTAEHLTFDLIIV